MFHYFYMHVSHRSNKGDHSKRGTQIIFLFSIKFGYRENGSLRADQKGGTKGHFQMLQNKQVSDKSIHTFV
jgi:hypothetical protein